MQQTKEPKGSIVIAHLADLHLRDAQYASRSRGVDFYTAALKAVEIACDKADIITIVGDVFDKPRPSPNIIGQLMAIDALCRNKNRLCLTTTGNHDWNNPTWLKTLFPDRGQQCESGIIPMDGNRFTFKGHVFVGVNPYTESYFKAHLNEIGAECVDADVVLYHGLIDGVADFKVYGEDRLHARDLPIQPHNKAWLLGDIHVPGHVFRAGCYVGYPGSTEVCNASEPHGKTFRLIKLDSDECIPAGKVAIPTRDFLSRTVNTEDDLQTLLSDVRALDDPVVIVKYNRDLTDTVVRLNKAAGSKALVRCYPLPRGKQSFAPKVDGVTDDLSIDHFMRKKFKNNEVMLGFSERMLAQGPDETDRLVTDYIEERSKNNKELIHSKPC